MPDHANAAELSKLAHSLKGILLEAGAKEAARLASAMESSFKAGDSQGGLAKRSELQKHTLRAAGVIEKVLTHLPS